MNTSEFLSLLKQHQDKSLLFEYTDGKLVGANYHITEVKNITIDSIDCGTQTDFWKETIVQLWESPKEIGKTDYMSAYKALAILNKVDRVKPMTKEAEVKIEYSNESFHTAQLFVSDYALDTNTLTFKLSVKKTDCKAKETCGVEEKSSEKVVEASCCGSDTGCC